MNLEQEKTPIIDALIGHIEAGYTSFHTPGHKNGAGMDEALAGLIGSRCLKLDLTELPDLDDLHIPNACIAEAQKLAADAFGAGETFFLVNGSSCGIQAAMMALGNRKKIILPRNIHRSVIAGLILSDGEPIWVKNSFHPELNIPLPPTVDEYKFALHTNNDVDGLFYINPTYHGFCGDMAGVVKLAHSEDIPLIVDEAHGPHLHFHKKYPESAVDLGADIVIQSSHKLLSAMNQGSMLHVHKNSLISGNVVFRQLMILQTTSPSFVLLAVLDAARKQMAVQGESLLGTGLVVADELRGRLRDVPGLTVGDTDDPCKLLVSVKEIGITGFQAAEFLRERGIQPELADIHNLLFIITHGNSKEDFTRLIEGFTELGGKLRRGPAFHEDYSSLFEYHDIPRIRMRPREAWFSKRRRINIDESVGEICAEIVAPYPPGVPVLCPGEQIDNSVVERFKVIRALNLAVHGTEDNNLSFINVVD